VLNSTLRIKNIAKRFIIETINNLGKMNLKQPFNFSNQIITLEIAWKKQNCVFGGSNGALTSNHGPGKGERRSGPIVGLSES